jgi:hypothetical protein
LSSGFKEKKAERYRLKDKWKLLRLPWRRECPKGEGLKGIKAKDKKVSSM